MCAGNTLNWMELNWKTDTEVNKLHYTKIPEEDGEKKHKTKEREKMKTLCWLQNKEDAKEQEEINVPP